MGEPLLCRCHAAREATKARQRAPGKVEVPCTAIFFRTGLRCRQCPEYGPIESFYPLFEVIRVYFSKYVKPQGRHGNSDGLEKAKGCKASIYPTRLNLLTDFRAVKVLGPI